ncbi:MAG: hypothetical protein R2688_10780 [Fimbriimonadaceae bacterium]
MFRLGVFIDKEQQGGGPLIDIGVHPRLHSLPNGLSQTCFCQRALLGYSRQEPDLFNFLGDYDRSKFTVEDMAVGFIRFEDGQVVVLESSFMANVEREFFKRH